jgi:hypothetical protein
MQNQQTGTSRPNTDQDNIPPQKRDDIEHITETGLPLGISPDEAADPGRQTPGTTPDSVRGK